MKLISPFSVIAISLVYTSSSTLLGESFPFVLPPLPYTYDALEPYIDARTMQIHYTKHHQAYIDNLNKAIELHPELKKKTLRQLLTSLDTINEDVRTTIRNNAGGHENHSLFWTMMSPHGGGLPKGRLAAAISRAFGSFEKFKEQFTVAAKSRFGSGWAWLSVDKQGNLQISSTGNQDSPLTEGLEPILGLDVWEHAYYLKYQWKRPDYIDAWWHVVNWAQVEKNFKTALAQLQDALRKKNRRTILKRYKTKSMLESK